MKLNENIFLNNLDRTIQQQFCISFPIKLRGLWLPKKSKNEIILCEFKKKSFQQSWLNIFIEYKKQLVKPKKSVLKFHIPNPVIN